jgi:hypothetical protein
MKKIVKRHSIKFKKNSFSPFRFYKQKTDGKNEVAKLRGAYCNFLFYKGAKKVYKLSSLYSCSSNAGKASSILKRRHQTEAYWILHGPVALIPRESDHGTDNIQHIVRDQEQFWALL